MDEELHPDAGVLVETGPDEAVRFADALSSRLDTPLSPPPSIHSLEQTRQEYRRLLKDLLAG